MRPPLSFPGAVTEIDGRLLPEKAIPAGYVALIAAYGVLSDRLKQCAMEAHARKPKMIENCICSWLLAGPLILVLLMGLIFPPPHPGYDLPALLL